MKTYIACIFSIWVMAGLTFLTPLKSFPQSSGEDNKINATASVRPLPEGESAYIEGMTAGRSKSIVAGIMGLISIAVGWRAKARSVKKGAVLALLLGLICTALSIAHLSASAGTVFGSGSGKAGAIVALVLGIIGIWVAGLTLRSSGSN